MVSDGNTYENTYFKLTSDLDMGASEGHTFTMIGTFDKYFDSDAMQNVDGSKYFKGILDGDYHTIDNLKIEYVNEELGGTGLFACTTNGTVIRNLIIGANSTVKGGITSGMFVGQMNGGLIENCQNKGTLDANMYTGGIVGVMEGGTVKCCVNNGNLKGATELGGIVGQGAANGNVEYCYNTGEITCIGFGGGGIGGALYDTFKIENCYSTGAVSGESSPWMGSPHAIISDAGTGTVSNCYFVQELASVDDDKATAKTAEEMKSADMLATLNGTGGNNYFVADSKNINNGLPVLYWQAKTTTGIKMLEDNVQFDLTIDGNTVSSNKNVSVYTLDGRQVATGFRMTLGKGTYILKADGGVRKVSIR